MVCRYDVTGRCYRYSLQPDGQLKAIEDAYLNQHWYLRQDVTRGSRMWVTCVVPALECNFKAALNTTAGYYLEWFDHVCSSYNSTVRKRYSYLGAIGGAFSGRDLGNKVYAIVIVAAFQIRAQQRLPQLQCSMITTTEGRGDIIKTMLGIVWHYEHILGIATTELMLARASLEAACLGVELLKNNMPRIWNLDVLKNAVLDAPDFVVRVPSPSARGYQQADEAWRSHQEQMERKNLCRLVLSKVWGQLVQEKICSYLKTAFDIMA